MSFPSEMQQRHVRVLGRLTELGLDLCERLHDDALAAEGPLERAESARAFHTVSRSVRQTMALEAKFHRDAQRAEREDRDLAVKAESGRIETRRQQVRRTVEPLIWTEAESDAESLCLGEDLDTLLDLEILAGDFGHEALEVHVERIKTRLGLLASPVPPPSGEVSAQPTEGVRSERSDPTLPPAAQPIHPGGSPQPAFAGSSPGGGATGWLSG